MNTVRVSVSVSGTDDNGNVRSFVGSGTIACTQAVIGDLLATTTQVKINDSNAGDAVPSFVYIENHGTVDVAFGVVDVNDVTRSLVVPPSGATIISVIPLSSTAATALDVRLWTVSSTAQVHYILFY
jgi:hypothetical protein